MQTLTCTIKAILFPRAGQPPKDNGFSIVSALPDGQRECITVKGCMPGIRTGLCATFTGDFRTDSFGKAFIAKDVELSAPSSIEGIKGYLASGLISGIGPKLAEQIVITFGERTLDILDADPGRLCEVSGIGKKKLRTLIDCWEEQKGIREVMVFLKSFDVSTALAAKIYKQYGTESLTVVRENPYRLCDDIGGVGFHTADRIALATGLPADSDERMRCALLHCLKEAASGNGHVFLKEDELLNAAGTLLGGTIPATDIARVLEDMAHGDTVQEDNRIYLPSSWWAEKEVAERLARMASRRDPSLRITDFTELERTCGITFDPIQKDAISVAAVSQICVITGGPGTGKTTTMRGLLALCDINKESVLLCAPTGRAAKRLSEATGRDASTIHRLLEYRPGEGFGKNESNPLDADLLVIDESSMIDLSLMHSLLKAVPDKMRVLMVGDADQLPSVGAGNILRDTIAAQDIPVVTLKTIFRQAQGSLIIRNSHAVNEGRCPELQERLSPKSEDFTFLERNDPARIQEDIVRLLTDYAPRNLGIAPQDIQVLSPMRRGPLGVEQLNRILQDALNPDGIALQRGETQYRQGDRVMQTRNDYDNDVFNGDIGTVTDVDPVEKSLTVDFDGEPVTVKGEALDNLELAYCTTIHKSQGSEYPMVVVPVTMGHYIMLMRNLLYTALTRAKKRCVLIGEKQAVLTMVSNNVIKKRNTFLTQRIDTSVQEEINKNRQMQ